MVLSEIDRSLLERCLARQPRAWEDFVDRFLGLVVHVINHTAESRSIRLTLQDTEDLAAEAFLGMVRNDFAVLRRFRGASSLATYLTVVTRRVVVHNLLQRRFTPTSSQMAAGATAGRRSPSPEERISNREEVERLLQQLNGTEAAIVRLYHLEGKSYQDISAAVGMPENSIGPTLSRARAKLRQASMDPQHR